MPKDNKPLGPFSPTGDYAIGNCRPPKEYQWKPGQCPNPKGRPRTIRKEKTVTLPTGTSDIQAKLIEFANTIIGEVGGEKVSNFDAMVKTMRSLIREKPEYGRLLFQAICEASKQEEAFKQLVLMEAIAHKEEWSEQFWLAQKMKKRPPDVVPHPDDIIIMPDGSVKFDGPILRHEKIALDGLLEHRDLLFKVAREVLEAPHMAEDEKKECWLVLRRQYYRFSKVIPRRLKLPFPTYEPTPRTDFSERP